MDYDMTDTRHSQWFDLHIYTLVMSVDNLVNTLEVSSDSGNLCLDIHQVKTQWIVCQC